LPPLLLLAYRPDAAVRLAPGLLPFHCQCEQLNHPTATLPLLLLLLLPPLLLLQSLAGQMLLFGWRLVFCLSIVSASQ
jgi:hypothetical protein